MIFTPDGEELLIGNSNATISVLEPDKSLQKKPTQQPLKTTENKVSAITYLTISKDGLYFATMDANCCVCLFKKSQMDPSKPIEWLFNGKKKTHEVEITSIAFGESLDENEEEKLRLFSIGKDKRLFEYDVEKSNMTDGLKVVTMFEIEQEAHPTACIWYPKIDTKEDLLLTVNDDYKMKIWNVSTKGSRRTCLGPTYGGEIVKLR